MTQTEEQPPPRSASPVLLCEHLCEHLCEGKGRAPSSQTRGHGLAGALQGQGVGTTSRRMEGVGPPARVCANAPFRARRGPCPKFTRFTRAHLVRRTVLFRFLADTYTSPRWALCPRLRLWRPDGRGYCATHRASAIAASALQQSAAAAGAAGIHKGAPSAGQPTDPFAGGRPTDPFSALLGRGGNGLPSREPRCGERAMGALDGRGRC